MPEIKRTITIKAPVEKVFTYLNTPANLLEIWPSMLEVKDVRTLPNGGPHFHWKYKMAGVPFEGDADTIEFVPEQHVVSENKGGLPSKFDWTYRRENGTTKLDVRAEYTIPKNVLGKLAEPLVIKFNEREMDGLLANLKDRLEI
jgi:uncharacterized membrane protein